MMWSSTVGLVNGKHRYLTAETFGFKINSNGQQLKRRQQWTIEPFPENLGPDGSISSAASVSSQCQPNQIQTSSPNLQQQTITDLNDPCILTLNSVPICSSLLSAKSSNGSSTSDQDVCGEEHENVAIKSHLNKYLAVDSFGNVTCDSEEKTETARFTITICSMSQGKSKDEHIFWAFKNVERGYYLGTTDDGMICCNAKMPKSRAELWHLHLLPAVGSSFFALKSLGRKRFARVVSNDSNGDIQHNQIVKQSYDRSQVQLDSTICWGPETLFQIKYHEGGQYSLLTSDDRNLTNEGKCYDWRGENETSLPPPECLFTLEYHSGFLAFRDCFGQYLAAAGRSSVLRSRSIGVSRDELFLFEVAPIQVSLKATFNNRWVSIKQGVDLSANQTETTSKFETFQMTYHKQTQNWSIMTKDCNFWTVSQNTNTISVCRPGDYEGLTRGQFRLVWSDTDATFNLKYVDSNRQERWISARKSGQLFLGGPNQEPVKFIMRFQNRRLLNLRPIDGSGFVGLKGANSKQIEANKTTPDTIAIEYSELPTTITIVNGTATVETVLNNNAHLKSAAMRTATTTANDIEQSSNGNELGRINMFNVKLNSTKNGQSVLEKIAQNNTNSKSNESKSGGGVTNRYNVAAQTQKEIDCGIIDDNNNNCMLPDEMATKTVDERSNGNIESSSAPSVASIINSFSNAKINNGNQTYQSTNELQQNKVQQLNCRATGKTVSKLASSFETGTPTSSCAPTQANQQLQQQQQHIDSSDAASSCSTANGSTFSNNSNDLAIELNMKNSLSDQVAQSESCYMKIVSNEKYLTVGDPNETNILCDATNKACAQAWILELRSHNSLAIRTSDNHAYMQLGTNGTIYLSRCEPKEASLWEF